MAAPWLNAQPLRDEAVAQQLGIPVARVRAIRAANRARPPAQPAGVPTARPLSGRSSLALAAAGRGSGVIDPTRTATNPAVVQQLREQFSGPATSGYNFLAFTLGKHLAGEIGPHLGATPPLGSHPSPWLAAANLAADLPSTRLAGAAFRGVQALRAGQELGTAVGAAQSAMRQHGPLAQLEGRVGQWLAGGSPASPLDRAAAKTAALVMRTAPPVGVRPGYGRAFKLASGRGYEQEKQDFRQVGRRRLAQQRRTAAARGLPAATP